MTSVLLWFQVILNSPVCQLQQDADHVVVTCEDGKKYQAQFVISAIPQALLNSVSFNPPLPPLKNQLIQRIPMGSVIKTVTFYEKAFWREKGFNGVLISDSSPAYVTVDDTKPDGSYPAIMRLVIISVSTFLSKRWLHLTSTTRICSCYLNPTGNSKFK